MALIISMTVGRPLRYTALVRLESNLGTKTGPKNRLDAGLEEERLD